MKIKEGYLMRQIAGRTVVLPNGDRVDMDMMITLNGTGAFLWERMLEDTNEDALTAAVLAEYDVDAETARQSVCAFVKKLADNGFLAE